MDAAIKIKWILSTVTKLVLNIGLSLRQIKDNFTESIQGYTAGNIQITKQNLSLRLLYL